MVDAIAELSRDATRESGEEECVLYASAKTGLGSVATVFAPEGATSRATCLQKARITSANRKLPLG